MGEILPLSERLAEVISRLEGSKPAEPDPINAPSSHSAWSERMYQINQDTSTLKEAMAQAILRELQAAGESALANMAPSPSLECIGIASAFVSKRQPDGRLTQTMILIHRPDIRDEDKLRGIAFAVAQEKRPDFDVTQILTAVVDLP